MVRAALASGVVLACAGVGCGRLGFDPLAGTDGPTAIDADGRHDEDGDSLVDLLDPCPHVAGDATDTDGDRVGDACDPSPTVATETYVLFTPLVGGDNPFTTTGQLDQVDDALHWSGAGGIQLTIDQAVSNIRLDLGYRINAVLGTTQHQVAAGVEDGTLPYYFVELNDNQGNQTFALSAWDGMNYIAIDTMAHQGVHPGIGYLRFDAVATQAPKFSAEGGWVGELYTVAGDTTGYTGGSQVRFALNGLDIDLRYVVLIATQ